MKLEWIKDLASVNIQKDAVKRRIILIYKRLFAVKNCIEKFHPPRLDLVIMDVMEGTEFMVRIW